MPTYTTIPDSTIAPEAPVTSELMTLLRDNPISMAEGDGTAPKIKAKALDIRNAQATDSTLTATNLADLNYVMITGFIAMNHSGDDSTTMNVSYALSTDGGSSWGSSVSILTHRIVANDGPTRLSVSYVVDVSGSTNAIQISISGVGGSGINPDSDITLLNIG
jgi:hypothetical protein